MSAAASKIGRMPARIEPDKSYRGRVSRLWIDLRDGRDVTRILASLERQGCKVSMATYYNWESGRSDPPISALPAIAKALGVSVNDLFPKR